MRAALAGAVRYRFFKIPPHGGAEEQELNQFLASHRVLSVDRQFASNGVASLWAVCVSYLEGPEPVASRKTKVDYRELLSEPDFALFAKLRALRKELSEADGVPPYALFTNEQLAAMVQRRVSTKAELLALDGVGEARAGKYGEAFVAALRVFLGAGEGRHAAQPGNAG